MNNREVFEIWAHPASPWSNWAKPTLFATWMFPTAPPLPLLPDFAWDDRLGRNWAIIVDLPGKAAVLAGLAMAREGFRPIPLFNGCSSNMKISSVDTSGMGEALYAGAVERVLRDLPADAPPAFLIDSRRKSSAMALRPGMLDNRWVVFPQDFPSGAYLHQHGITDVAVVREEPSRPDDDLLHVLRRWEEAGLHIHLQGLTRTEPPQPFSVPRPPHFRMFLYSMLARMGLRQSFAGGFGGIIPQPSQG